MSTSQPAMNGSRESELASRIEQRRVKSKLIRIGVATILIGVCFVFWEIIEILLDPVVKVYAGLWGGFTLCLASMGYALRSALTARLTVRKVQTHRGCTIMGIILCLTLLAVCIIVFVTAKVIPQVDTISFSCNVIRIALCAVLLLVTVLHYRVAKSLLFRLSQSLSAPSTVSEAVIVSNVPGTMVIGGFEHHATVPSIQLNLYEIEPPSYMDVVSVQAASRKPQ